MKGDTVTKASSKSELPDLRQSKFQMNYNGQGTGHTLGNH